MVLGAEAGEAGKSGMHARRTWLMLPVAVAGMLVVFGAGFIAGMWYHTQQPRLLGSTLYTSESQTSAFTNAEEPQAERLTFYETLTASPSAYAPLTPGTDTFPDAPHIEPQGAESSASAAPLSAPGTASLAMPSQPRRPAEALPPLTTAPTRPGETRKVPGRPPVTQQPRTAISQPNAVAPGAAGRRAPSARPRKEAPVQVGYLRSHHPRDSAPRSTSAGSEAQQGVRVQVGSFAVPERAAQLRRRLPQPDSSTRVQTAPGPAQSARSRVRVGDYATPESTNQSARHLAVQEQVPTVIAR